VHTLKETKADRASQLEMDKKATEMASLKKCIKIHLFVVWITPSGILPVGLIISLICALIFF